MHDLIRNLASAASGFRSRRLFESRAAWVDRMIASDERLIPPPPRLTEFHDPPAPSRR